MISRDDIRVKAQERIKKEREEFEKKSQDHGKKQNKNAGQGDQTSGTSKPEIITSKRYLDALSNECISALKGGNDPPFIFIRTGNLAQIRTDEKSNPRIVILNDIQLRGIMAQNANFLKMNHKGKLEPTSPPIDMVRDVLHRGSWPFPPLQGILRSPVLRADGTILDRPGYDEITGLFYFQTPGLVLPSIPNEPLLRDVENARKLLHEPIKEFPFVSPADVANYLGLIITLPLRHAIEGPVPMALITAPTPGSGKTLLTDIVSIISIGQAAPLAGIPRDDDEVRKFLTSRLITGDPLIPFDNVDYPLWSPSLCRALTGNNWEDRILGLSKTVCLPQRSVFIANGNNIMLRGDLPRRCFPINLNAKTARPWERRDFQRKNLRRWVAKHRGELLGAILTLAKAWIMAGKPAPKKPMPQMGGFEAWVEVVGGVLNFAGIEGFLENVDEFHQEVDMDGPEWEAFFSAWSEIFGVTPKTCHEVSEVLKSDVLFAATLPSDLGDILKDPGRSFSKSLGRALARVENRPFGDHGLAVQKDGSRDGSTCWKVSPASSR